MDLPEITRNIVELREFEAGAREQIRTIFNRLDKQDAIIDSLRALTANVGALAEGQERIEKNVKAVRADVDEIKAQPTGELQQAAADSDYRPGERHCGLCAQSSWWTNCKEGIAHDRFDAHLRGDPRAAGGAGDVQADSVDQGAHHGGAAIAARRPRSRRWCTPPSSSTARARARKSSITSSLSWKSAASPPTAPPSRPPSRSN